MLFKKRSKLVFSRVFLLIPILLATIAFQTKEPVLSTTPDLDDNAFIEAFQTDTGHIFIAAEAPLSPPRGMNAFKRSIADNYIYPKEAKEANVKGDLIVSFVVEKDGSFSDIKVIEDLGYGTGEEIIRVLKSSQRWSSGIWSGRVIRAQYKLLISIGEKIEAVSISQPTFPGAQSSSNVTNELP